ncbi:hypothetical protein ACFL08_00050 [Patescibacteria group bacterium]
MMEILVPTSAESLRIEVETYSDEKRSVDVFYRFSTMKRLLYVTINDVMEDDISVSDIISLLRENEVVSEGENWAVDSVQDSDGLITEGSFVTIIFKKI